MRDLGDFIKSPFFIKNICILAGTGIVLLLLVFIWLRIYTRHNDFVNVPDLRGLQEKEVAKICEDRGLRYQIVDSVYGTFAKKGTVVDQTPPGAFKVKKDRIIFLTIKAYSTEKVIMPELCGSSINQARADLESVGLGVGRISYRPDIAKDNVLEQRLGSRIIAPGTTVEKGVLIDLILGTGEDGDSRTVIPDVEGFTLYSAGLLAAENSLNIGAKIFDETISSSADTATAVIYKQMPQAGNTATLGSDINVWLTSKDNYNETQE